MSLWNDSELKWALESESKSGIEEKTSASLRYIQLIELHN